MKSKIKSVETAIISIVICIVIIALTVITYSWIEGTTSPSISGNDIQLAHSPGLVMALNGKARDVIDINKFISDTPDAQFVLSEASSADGVNLFLRDSMQYVTDASNPSVEYMCFKKATDSDVNRNYIQFDFTLTADGGSRDVWFDNSKTYIKTGDGVALKPIRVSLEATDSTPNNGTNNNKTVIFGTTTESENNTSANATKAIYELNSDNTAKTKGQNVRTFSSFSSSSSKLYSLKENEVVAITIRVWLEGGDSDCVDEISGELFGMCLYFDSTVD